MVFNTQSTVFPKILSFCSFSVLLRFPSVCKDWHEVALGECRRRTQIPDLPSCAAGLLWQLGEEVAPLLRPHSLSLSYQPSSIALPPALDLASLPALVAQPAVAPFIALLQHQPQFSLHFSSETAELWAMSSLFCARLHIVPS
jgi:hypothetical protein